MPQARQAIPVANGPVKLYGVGLRGWKLSANVIFLWGNEAAASASPLVDIPTRAHLQANCIAGANNKKAAREGLVPEYLGGDA
jgi:hypothetical protein